MTPADAPPPALRIRRALRRPGPVAGMLLLVAFQAACLAVFAFSTLGPVLGLRSRPIGWQWLELIQIAALLGLAAGLVLGARGFLRSLQSGRAAEAELRRVTATFRDVLARHFADWGLTPAERDVALLAIKGLSLQEIARLRDTSEGTVRAQTAAIYRKAGVTGRPQLLALFIEEMMRDDPAPRPAPPAAQPVRARAP